MALACAAQTLAAAREWTLNHHADADEAEEQAA